MNASKGEIWIMLSGCASKNAWFGSCQVICFIVYDYKYLIWHNAKYELTKKNPIPWSTWYVQKSILVQ